MVGGWAMLHYKNFGLFRKKSYQKVQKSCVKTFGSAFNKSAMKWFLLFLFPTAQAIYKCISFYGIETEMRNYVCSWYKPIEYYIPKLKGLGFNTIRIPFSYQYIQEGNFQNLDRGIVETYKHNMSVILDYHRIWNNKQGESPLSDGLNIDQWIESWLVVLRRYKEFSNVFGMNVWNEYQKSDINFIRWYSETLLTRVEKEMPNRMVYFVTGTNWGNDLRNMSMEHLPFKDRIFYSTHKYPWSNTRDERDWEETFGSVEGIPTNKLIVGEFGWTDKDEEWAVRFFKYLKKKGIRDSCFWSHSNSHDTGNLYKDDCQIFNLDNYLLLKTYWEDDRRLKTKYDSCRFVGWNGCLSGNKTL